MEFPLLYLIRHGRTDLNARNLFRGNVDVPLDKVGIQDGEEAADFLKDVEPSFLVSSDKQRALQTAKVFEDSWIRAQARCLNRLSFLSL